MRRSDLTELHYVAPISNVPSILAYGIVTHRAAARLAHASVAMPEIQERRARRTIPGGKPLHDYVNLYLCARNPMLYLRRRTHATLCVLRVGLDVLDLDGVIIADGNAASDYTAFWPSPNGLAKVDQALVFGEYWTDENQIVQWQKKRVKCAEVLVPGRVDSRFIAGAYVSCTHGQQALQTLVPGVQATIDAHLFFVR